MMAPTGEKGRQMINTVWNDRILDWPNRLVPLYAIRQLPRTSRDSKGKKKKFPLGAEWHRNQDRAAAECAVKDPKPQLQQGLRDIQPTGSWDTIATAYC